MLTPLHSVIYRGEYEKYLFLSLYGNTENSLVTAHALNIDYSQWKSDYASFSVLSNILQNDLSKRIAC